MAKGVSFQHCGQAMSVTELVLLTSGGIYLRGTCPACREMIRIDLVKAITDLYVAAITKVVDS